MPREGAGASKTPENEFDEFLSGSPEEVLARFGESDPLDLPTRCRRRIVELSLLLQPDRLLHRACARIAHAAPNRGNEEVESFVSYWIDHSIEELLREDWEGDRYGLRCGPGWRERYAQIARTLGVDASTAREMSVRLNNQEQSIRQAFHRVVLQGQHLEDYMAAEGLTKEQVSGDLKEAFILLATVRDPKKGHGREEAP